MSDFAYFRLEEELCLAMRGGTSDNYESAIKFLDDSDDHKQAKKLLLSFHDRLSHDQSVNIFLALGQKLPNLQSFTFMGDSHSAFSIRALGALLTLRAEGLVSIKCFGGHTLLTGTLEDFNCTFDLLSRCTKLREVLFHARFVNLDGNAFLDNAKIVDEEEQWFSDNLVRALSQIETLETLSLHLWSAPKSTKRSAFAKLLGSRTSQKRLSSLTIEGGVSTWKLSLPFLQTLFSRNSRLEKVTMFDFEKVNLSARSIAKALQGNRTVKDFSLITSQQDSWKRFTVGSLARILEALKDDTTLECLALSMKWEPWLAARHAPLLISAIEEAKNLKKLELCLTVLEEPDQLGAILQGAARSKSLAEVVLRVEDSWHGITVVGNLRKAATDYEMEMFENTMETNLALKKVVVLSENGEEVPHSSYLSKKAASYLKRNEEKGHKGFHDTKTFGTNAYSLLRTMVASTFHEADSSGSSSHQKKRKLCE
ncbi:expressed unknown protein [Seminavis robusta]|uniref:Uncharacterized protein n=1 Tax=Seminavis robusta TaxID=568900 RepID=A0A9N8HG09_9STRA|nr:expressed unknown protein [Seminavis robusta]|eukprot:Sro460_g147530.1 n/a (482) ;mRNA; r:35070-36515